MTVAAGWCSRCGWVKRLKMVARRPFAADGTSRILVKCEKCGAEMVRSIDTKDAP